MLYDLLLGLWGRAKGREDNVLIEVKGGDYPRQKRKKVLISKPTLLLTKIRKGSDFMGIKAATIKGAFTPAILLDARYRGSRDSCD